MKIVTSKPEFSVDMYGNVYWTKTNTKLKPFKDKDGYLRVSYRYRNKTHHIAPHRAVAEMYVANPKPDMYKVVNHKDSVRHNNIYTNLEWASNRINTNHAHMRDRFNNIKGIRHSHTVLTLEQVKEICYLLSLGKGVTEISKEVNQPKHRISNIKFGRCWREISLSYGLVLPPERIKEGDRLVNKRKNKSWYQRRRSQKRLSS